MKVCHACKNEINIRANKCSFCGEIQDTNQTRYNRKLENSNNFFRIILHGIIWFGALYLFLYYIIPYIWS